MDLAEQALCICMRELRGNDKRKLAQLSAGLWQHFDVEYRVQHRQRLKSYVSDGVKIKCVVYVDGQRHNGVADGAYAFSLYHITPADMSLPNLNPLQSKYKLYSKAIQARELRYARKSAITGLYINYDGGRALELAQMFPLDAGSLDWMPLMYVRHPMLEQDPCLKRFRGRWFLAHANQCYLLGHLLVGFRDDHMLLNYLQIAEQNELPFWSTDYGTMLTERSRANIIGQYNDKDAPNHKGGYLCHFK